MKKDKNRVCPVSKAKSLDTFIRRLLQNPIKIFQSYIIEGMTILDYGCGPGYFTWALAKLAGENGKVFAVDLQEEMLNIAKSKISDIELSRRIIFQKCSDNSTDIKTKVDLINAFYVIHEVKNHEKIFKEFYSILNEGGILFMSEPKFHVNKEEFKNTTNKAINSGFEEEANPKIWMSRTSVLIKK